MKKYLEYIFYSFGYVLWLVFSLVMFFESTQTKVPFWNLSEKLTTLILLLIWPLVASLFFGFLGKIIFSRIYLWLFKKFNKDMTLGYVKPIHKDIDWKKTFIRLFNVFLVTVGLVDAFLAADIIIPENFLTQIQLEGYISAGINPKYTPKVLSQMLCLIIPVSVGLWSVVWSLEDIGLVQYKIRNIQKDERFSEMLPLYKGVSSFISGYGGISAVIFYLGYFTYFFTEYNQLGGNFGDLILFLFLIFTFLSIYPTLVLLKHSSPRFLIKNLPLSPTIQIIEDTEQ